MVDMFGLARELCAARDQISTDKPWEDQTHALLKVAAKNHPQNWARTLPSGEYVLTDKALDAIAPVVQTLPASMFFDLAPFFYTLYKPGAPCLYHVSKKSWGRRLYDYNTQVRGTFIAAHRALNPRSDRVWSPKAMFLPISIGNEYLWDSDSRFRRNPFEQGGLVRDMTSFCDEYVSPSWSDDYLGMIDALTKCYLVLDADMRKKAPVQKWARDVMQVWEKYQPLVFDPNRPIPFIRELRS